MLDIAQANQEHKQVLNKLSSARLVALDFETTGLDPWTEYARPCGLAVAWGEEEAAGAYYPVGHLSGDNVPWDMLREVWELLVEKDKLVLFYNAKFDIKIGSFMGLPDLPRIVDVMGTVHLTNENLPRHSLDYSARALLPGYESHKDVLREYMKERGIERFHEVPVEIMKPYAISDAAKTMALWNLLKDQLVKEELVGVQKIENRLCRTIARIESKGVYADLDYARKAIVNVREGLGILQNKIDEYAPGLNPSSTKQLTEAFNGMGVYSPIKTKSGADSWKAEALALIDHPLAVTISEFRNFKKLHNTYFSDLIYRASLEPGDGRIHPSLNAHAARTGRLSASDPNIQALPKYGRNTIAQTAGGDEEGDLVWISDEIAEAAEGDEAVRKMLADFGRVDSLEAIQAVMADVHGDDTINVRRVLCATPGRVMIRSDYSQMEMCYFAHASEDPNMISIFEEENFDIHNEVARRVWPEAERFDVDSKEFKVFRRYAKAINFGMLYGMGVKALALQIGTSREEAEKFLEQYWEAFPRARKFMDESSRRAEVEGYVTTYAGRRRRLNPELAYRAINAIVQGSCADIMKIAMNRIDDYWQANPNDGASLFTVHDELGYELEPNLIQTVVPKIEDMMLDFPTTPRFQVDTTVGMSYGDKGDVFKRAA